MRRRLDDIDRTLLRALSSDGRHTLRALAGMVKLSEPSVRDRLHRLERDGVITGYHATLEPALVDAAAAAFIALRFKPGEAARHQVNEALLNEPCVLEVHEVAGEDCYGTSSRPASHAPTAAHAIRTRTVIASLAPARAAAGSP